MSEEDGPTRWLARLAEGETPAEPLENHLRAVARRCLRYAEKIGYPDLGYNAGLLHDIGKASPHFQRYLRGERARDGYLHPAAGAIWADSPISFPIACHHTGLRARTEVANRLRDQAGDPRVQDAIERGRSLIGEQLTEAESLPEDPARRAVLLRMLHSALIDADWTTVGTREGEVVPPNPPPIETIAVRMIEAQEAITDRSSEIGRIRDDIRQRCVEAAGGEPGIYRASIPTGGGKTRALMEMALRHAQTHGHSRVIVLAPYVTILQQTAAVHREILGEEAVLEHHGQVELIRASTREHARATSRWDRPVIVSTFVQGLESLMHTANSQLRKIHRFADSVVILDEIQNLPYDLRETTIWLMEELSRLGATVIASSATQIPMPGTEIIPDPPALYKRMKRVQYHYDLTERTPEQLWNEAAGRSMIVVNTTADARRLARARPSAYHLSTKMTPAHREAVIAKIRDQLGGKEREDVQLVTTQIVEAGVDLDFDQVIRLLGPMDNVIQAAGRCNREGRSELGEVLITRLEEGGCPPGAYQAGREVHEEMIDLRGPMDLTDPAWLARFYERMESRVGSKHVLIKRALEEGNFPAAREAYELISSAKQVDVLVRHPKHGASDELVGRLRDEEITTGLLREARPYIVSPYIWEAETMAEEGQIEPIREDLDLHLWTGAYDDRLGITEA